MMIKFNKSNENVKNTELCKVDDSQTLQQIKKIGIESKIKRIREKIINIILNTNTSLVKASEEEKQLFLTILENCPDEKLYNLKTTTARLRYIRKTLYFQQEHQDESYLKNFSSEIIVIAIRRITRLIRQYRNKYDYSFLSCIGNIEYVGNNMDDVEIAVDSFVDKFYNTIPDDDIYTFVYLLYVKNKAVIMKSCREVYKNLLIQNESEMKESEIIKTILVEKRKMIYDLLFQVIITRYDSLINDEDKTILIKKWKSITNRDFKIYKKFKNRNGINLAEMSFIDSNLIMKDVFCSILDEYNYYETGDIYINWLENFKQV